MSRNTGQRWVRDKRMHMEKRRIGEVCEEDDRGESTEKYKDRDNSRKARRPTYTGLYMSETIGRSNTKWEEPNKSRKRRKALAARIKVRRCRIMAGERKEEDSR